MCELEIKLSLFLFLSFFPFFLHYLFMCARLESPNHYSLSINKRPHYINGSDQIDKCHLSFEQSTYIRRIKKSLSPPHKQKR